MSTEQVHFIRGGASYLPELAAYEALLRERGHASVFHDSAATVPGVARILWWICGRVPSDAGKRWPTAFHVHEYASASVPPAAGLKDRIKRWTHPVPQHRIFQSEWVQGRMGLDDGVPCSFRDMGVPATFLDAKRNAVGDFDLVYLGETSRLMAFSGALRAIREAGLSLLVVGAIDDRVRAVARDAQCAGRIPQENVPSQLLRARAGLNLMPNRLPFSQQTSTKVLEYLAVGLPVLGNDYAWFRRTAAQFPGRLKAVDVDSAQQWRTAMTTLPGVEADRSHLAPLTWPSRLAGLPVWDALP
jgi:hypothetical protein